jgi:TPR repeat protein
MRNLLLAVFALFLTCAPSFAAEMQYPPDPVYQSFDPDEESPMQDMLDLAKNGDVRAQYILGDLYSKGKGGLPKDEKKAAEWFETAAKGHYYESFIRLAALAKRHGKSVEAWKWYTLAINYLDYGPWRDHANTARDALIKDAEMTQEELDEGRKQVNLWKSDFRAHPLPPPKVAEKEEDQQEKKTP